MAASCRSRASCRAPSPTASSLASSSGRSGKVSGIYRMLGKDQSKLPSAKAGETVALGKLDDVKTGDTLSSAKGGIAALAALDAAAAGLLDRAAGPRSARTRSSCRRPRSAWPRKTRRSSLQHQQDSSETLLSGHGEMHLRVIIERLEGKNQIPIERHAPAVPYRETIRKARHASAAATRSSRAATASSATS